MNLYLREKLKYPEVEKFDSIVKSKVLGASNHLRIITEIAEAIDLYDVSTEEKLTMVKELFDFFIIRRGKESHAVQVSLTKMIESVEALKRTDINNAIKITISNFRKEQDEDIDKLVSYAINIFDKFNTIMVFDYSSTIEKCIVALKNHKTLFVADSRVIEGGKPFLKPFINAGHKVYFIHDAAIYQCIKKCDAVVIGAETFDIDGGVYNTVGSDLVGYLCDKFEIPLYVVTTLSKFDDNSLQGRMKECHMKSQNEKFKEYIDEEILANISTEIKTLVKVPYKQVSGYITEAGYFPPSGINVKFLER